MIVADAGFVRPPSTKAYDDFRSGRAAFVAGLLPSDAIRMAVDETVALLRDRYGDAVDLALEAAGTPTAELPGHVRTKLRSPVGSTADASWLKRANVVGVNVRTIGDVWAVVPYSLTLPAVQGAIHLLPILEPGVAASLYGHVSWNVDPAIRSARLADRYPVLDSAEAQLRAVVHLLHVTGRTVGMDVIPHTDRFSEIGLAQPDLFEWLRRRGDRIVDHGDRVTAQVEQRIGDWLARAGPAETATAGDAPSPDALFRDRDQAERTSLLFGRPDDPDGRRRRRIALLRELHSAGLETVPATMGPPYRGIEADPAPEARLVDDLGLTWQEFRVTEPTPMSRVFGPLARYRLHESAGGDDSASAGWALDFDRPREPVWRYVIERYADLRDRFGFDFMRGDMSHVQMRPEGLPARVDERYDILGAVALGIRRRGTPWFGFLAESFLAGPGFMAYGAEPDHLEAAGADTALGDLQSVAVDDPAFVRGLRWYRDLLATRLFAPSFTVLTADKDDPRFDGLYRRGNELRLFLGLFLADMPSYMSLGFEQRDVHEEPAPNEHYTKLYVFQLRDGPRATHGPYRFGTNVALFDALARIRETADGLGDELSLAVVDWLCPPDATAATRVLAWRVATAETILVGVANLDLDTPAPRFGLPSNALPPAIQWTCLLATGGAVDPRDLPAWNGCQWVVPELRPGEGRLFRVSPEAYDNETASRSDPPSGGGPKEAP